jgi:hypothetical protein
MKGIFTATFVLLAMSAVPTSLPAKEKTTKITITGGSLATAVEITDPKILDSFNVWTGPGTSSNEAEGFIVKWSRGAIAEPPNRLPQYQVSFYTARSAERPFYLVSYSYDPSLQRGYVHFPGFVEKWYPQYPQDVGAIFRGVEGNWFFSRTVWDTTVEPFIAKAEAKDAK